MTLSASLPFPIQTFLAPMEGITAPAFRALIGAKAGVDVLCTEFVRVAGAGVGRKSLSRHVVKYADVPLSVQVMGNDVAAMADAAKLVEGAGADIVDINLGCPSPKAVRGGVGAAMLDAPQLLAQVLTAMRQQVTGILSAKMRAGVTDASGVLQTARLIEDSGVQLLTIHPRRRADGYGGVADWRVIAAVKDAVRIPVIGNGDCWCAADLDRMRTQTGCDGVMVGRGALRNPWIFSQALALREGRAPYLPAGDDVVAHLCRLAAGAKRPSGVLGHLKEHLRYLRRAVPDGRQLLLPALRCTTLPSFFHEVEERLGPLAAGALDLGVQSELEHSGAMQDGTAIMRPCRLTPT